MAETMLLALEGDASRRTFGNDVNLANLPWLEAAADRAGFRLSGCAKFDDVELKAQNMSTTSASITIVR